MTAIETKLDPIIADTKFDEKGNVSASEGKSLKALYDDLEPKENEYNQAQKAWEEAGEDEKPAKAADRDKAKGLWETAKTVYDTARKRLTQLCLVELDKSREDLRREKFSQAVSEYRNQRSVSQREKEIRDLEAEIEVLQLNVDEQNKKIEEIRGAAQAAG